MSIGIVSDDGREYYVTEINRMLSSVNHHDIQDDWVSTTRDSVQNALHYIAFLQKQITVRANNAYHAGMRVGAQDE